MILLGLGSLSALLGAIVTAAMAAIAGFADFFANARIRAIKDARTL